MAVSQHKTCLAILRGILGPVTGQEKRFSALIGKSVSWLKKASSGQIPLTQDVILRINFETGAPISWLTENDPTAPPTNERGQPYTRKIYDQRRAELAKDHSQSPTPRGGAIIASLIFDLLQINAAAIEANRGRLLALKLDEFNIEAQREFGKIHFRKNKAARKKALRITESLSELFQDPPEFVRYSPSRHDPQIPSEIFSSNVAFIRHGRKIKTEILEHSEVPERIPPVKKVPKGRKPQSKPSPEQQTPKPAPKPKAPSRKTRKKG
jgi:hypothetical protein